mmetsp:Transcript_93284/g.279843  ORF Transcript_93284/g.279843 Transcript_93284/m.279843 type:complete len:223 (+) Transcript_93284:579-1247(+)
MRWTRRTPSSYKLSCRRGGLASQAGSKPKRQPRSAGKCRLESIPLVVAGVVTLHDSVSLSPRARSDLVSRVLWNEAGRPVGGYCDQMGEDVSTDISTSSFTTHPLPRSISGRCRDSGLTLRIRRVSVRQHAVITAHGGMPCPRDGGVTGGPVDVEVERIVEHVVVDRRIGRGSRTRTRGRTTVSRSSDTHAICHCHKSALGSRENGEWGSAQTRQAQTRVKS